MRTQRTGMMAYLGIAEQVAAEAQAKPLPRVPLAAVWTPRGHEAFNKRGTVKVTYIVRLAPYYSRASFTYEG